MNNIATISKSKTTKTENIDINIRWKSNRSMFDLLRELDTSGSCLRLHGISIQ